MIFFYKYQKSGTTPLVQARLHEMDISKWIDEKSVEPLGYFQLQFNDNIVQLLVKSISLTIL